MDKKGRRNRRLSRWVRISPIRSEADFRDRRPRCSRNLAHDSFRRRANLAQRRRRSELGDFAQWITGSIASQHRSFLPGGGGKCIVNLRGDHLRRDLLQRGFRRALEQNHHWPAAGFQGWTLSESGRSIAHPPLKSPPSRGRQERGHAIRGARNRKNLAANDKKDVGEPASTLTQ